MKNILLIKKTLLNNHTHHSIRLRNILKVILNEIQINENVRKIVKHLVLSSEEDINNKLLKLLQKQELNDYKLAHEKYIEYADSKPEDIGKPKYYDNDSDTCVITLHGFSSAPKEVEQLSLYLHENGLAVYSPRLEGHGTSPEDLKHKTWQDWYDSVSRAITIASLKYKKLYLVGFSTGGLLALLSSKKSYHEFNGIICINAALNLNDIRVKTLLPAVSFWNDLVRAFNEDNLAKDYIDNNAENPDINYDKYYVESISQLNLLMSNTKKSLNDITTPTLILQAKDDPVVNPSSAYEIYNNISSEDKQIQILEGNNHVIVKGDNTKELYESILKFITSKLYPQFLH